MTKNELRMKKLSAISLGCDKNKVDLEKMLGKVNEYGIEVVANVDEADIVIVNTCAFIMTAEEEAINTIIEMEALKEKGVIEKLIVSGCFPERHVNGLSEYFPLVDKFMRLSDNSKIVAIIENLYEVEESKDKKSIKRVLTSPNSYAYLKIADGCNNACAYCTIPRIRGRYKSVPMDELLEEAKMLVDYGVKELILVAQDTTRYGEDLYGKNSLIELCTKLAKLKGLNYIRLHYLYPEKVTKELLDYIDIEPKMCKYLDIPLQHIDDTILTSMRRKISEEDTRNLVHTIKTEYPQLKVRSTFIVGFPQEGKKEFKKLCNFISEEKLDYVGFFAYSKEPNTSAFYMKKQVSSFIKKRRLKKIENIQNKIFIEKALEEVGKIHDVIVDRFDEHTGEYLGHSQFLSPTVDFGIRFVDNGFVKLGENVKVKIYDFDGSDFKGEVL